MRKTILILFTSVSFAQAKFTTTDHAGNPITYQEFTVVLPFAPKLVKESVFTTEGGAKITLKSWIKSGTSGYWRVSRTFAGTTNTLYMTEYEINICRGLWVSIGGKTFKKV